MSRDLSLSNNWIDLLEPRRLSNDLFFVLFHKWSCTVYENLCNRSPCEIKESVFQDPIIATCLKLNPNIHDEISQILNEMSHKFSLGYIRFLGFFIIKIMKSTNSNIWFHNFMPVDHKSFYYNCSNSVNEIINFISRKSPILYMPTHRSYADFIVFSYFCFQMNLPLPSIAAGIDFLSLKKLSSILRSCGAFYIRRSFKDSFLYWNVFRAYVKSQLISGERPIEVFVEGTRSRSGKSLYPKIGLLGIAIQLFLTSQIPDLVILPVNLCYDRVFEADLYVRELSLPNIDSSSGTKPKETVSNLFKAIKNLFSMNFGSIYIQFGRPISIREIKESYNLKKSFCNISKSSEFTPSQKQLEFTNDIAIKIVQEHIRSSVITSFSIACLIIWSSILETCNFSEFGPFSCQYYEFSLNEILEQIEEISNLLNYNCTANIFKRSYKEDLIITSGMHTDIFIINNSKITIESLTCLTKVRYYANSILQLLFPFCLAAYFKDKNHLLQCKRLLSREFIYLEEDFVYNKLSNPIKIHKVLINSLEFYIRYYSQLVNHILSAEFFQEKSLKNMIKRSQINCRVPLDIVQNFYSLLLSQNCLTKDNDYYCINKNNLTKLKDEITCGFDFHVKSKL